MRSVAEALLGRPLAEFAQGELVLGASLSWPWLLLLAAGLCTFAWFSYRRTTLPLRARNRAVLVALRAMLLLLLFAAMLQPAIRRYHVVPQESYLAILVDDSASMGVRDAGDDSRGEWARELLFGADGLAERFARNYRTRIFRFDRRAERIAGAGDLRFDGLGSNLGEGLGHVLEELKGFPLAAVVLVSDGADSGDPQTDPLQAARHLDAANIPVYTVGVGSEEIARDIALRSATAARTVVDDALFAVELSVANEGYEGARGELIVEEGGEVVASRQITFGRSGSVTRHQLELRPARREHLLYRVGIAPRPGEVIAQNNQLTLLVDNREGEPREILYIEGRPRNEYKFVQRAAATDPTLRLASYLRTGPGKFLRQGVTSPRELAEGFPVTEQELFRYEGILFGDVPRTHFTDAQLEAIEQFVARRGGGFLSLGVVEESYAGTPIADLLPVSLVAERDLPASLQGGDRSGDHPTGEDFSLELTREGRESPLLRLADDQRTNLRLWSEMPALQGIGVSGRPKPGAQVLARHPSLALDGERLPVIAVEKYGRGRTMAITSPSTWRWQMLAPLEDESHERVWRQILRWLTVTAPERIEIEVAEQSHAVGEPVEVAVAIADERYEEDDDATVWIEVTAPDGKREEFRLAWEIDQEGVYRGEFTPRVEGIHRVSATATTGAGEVIQASEGVLAAPSTAEFRNAEMDAGLLGRIAEIGGGRFYTGDDVARLVSDVEYSPGAYSRVETRDLWDMPLMLLLALILAGAEWFLRRRLGLA